MNEPINRRDYLAGQAMSAIMANKDSMTMVKTVEISMEIIASSVVARMAVAFADALIAELDKAK